MPVPAIALAAALGMNVHLPPSDTLDLAKDLGSEWVRIDFNWDVAEPTQGSYDWSQLDAVIDAADARGLHVYATIGYTPAWASISNDRNGDGPKNDVPDPAKYARFVGDAVQRYSNKVTAWGTWNEPNLGEFFEGTRDEWIKDAFEPAVDAIKGACSSCVVVGPELSTTGGKYADYLRAALASRGSELDAISFHDYASFPEDDPGAGQTKDSFYNKLDSHRVLKLGGSVVYEGPLSIREVLIDTGFADKPVWVTETGYQAAVGDQAALDRQKQYVGRVVDAMLCRPWWKRTFFYELSEEHPNGMWPDDHWGLALRTAGPDSTYADNFQKKPAFDALAARIQACASGSATGCTSSCDAGQAGAGGAGSGGTAGSAGAAGAGGSSATKGANARSGCGCRMADSHPEPFGPEFAGVLALLAALSRRRRGAPDGSKDPR